MPLFTILTLFPDALEPYLRCGVLGAARERRLVDVQLFDIRDWTRDRHRTVDDRPFGGGPGMVLKPEPLVECVEWVERRLGRHRRIALCPAGRRFDQGWAQELSSEPRVMLICGRYEGFDERVFETLELEPLSVGDFVLSGGELPAACVVEAAARLVPGVLGHEESAVQDSFRDGRGLDHPHYTRPRVFRGRSVPEVLLSGDHGAIGKWREERARERTLTRRPDLGGRTSENGESPARDS